MPGLSSFRLEEPAQRGDEDEVGPEEAFRRLNNTRKSKADKFLGNPTTRYELMSTASLALAIAPMTRLCISMRDRPDGDKNRGPDSKDEKRRRVRLHFKGPMAFAEDARPVRHTWVDVIIAANNAVARLWSALKGVPSSSLFAAATEFWPPDRPKTEMYEDLSENALRTIAAIKWRLKCKWTVPSFNAAELARYDSVEELPPGLLERVFAGIRDVKPCCLDPFWGRPVQQILQRSEEPSTGYFEIIKEFFRNFRGASLKEERRHSLQRRIAGGHTAMVRSFAQQASQSIISDISASWHARGGRNLQKATQDVISAAKHVRVRKTVHKRPRQLGNAMFTWIARQRSLGDTSSSAEAIQKWKSLPANTQAAWKATHRSKIRRQKELMGAVAAHAEAHQPPPQSESQKTLWDVGDQQGPLKLSILDEFIKPFRSRTSGLVALGEYAGSKEFEAEKACAAYKTRVEENRVKYHSMTAASLAAKALCLTKITGKTLDAVPTAKDIMNIPIPAQHCVAKHVGMCKEKRATKIEGVNGLVKKLPKESCVLRCETAKGRVASRKVVHVKLTVGWGH